MFVNFFLLLPISSLQIEERLEQVCKTDLTESVPSKLKIKSVM